MRTTWRKSAALAAVLGIAVLAASCKTSPKPAGSEPAVTTAAVETAFSDTAAAESTTVASDSEITATVTTGQGSTASVSAGTAETRGSSSTRQPKPWVTWTGTKTIPPTKAADTTASATDSSDPSDSNGTQTTAPTDTPTGPVEASMHSMLQTYIHSPTMPEYQSKLDFLTSVGYYPQGDTDAEPTDTLFDTFIFLPSPGYHHDGAQAAYSGCTQFTKEMLEDFFDVEFRSSLNLDALDAATAEVKQALGKPLYKVNVFLPYFNMIPTVRSFGQVDGRDLDFSKEEDRLAGVKWQIDEQIRRFNEKGYQNIQLAGFFYVTEALMIQEDDIMSTVQYANQYVAELGLETLFNPFNNAGTYRDKWQEAGFSMATMQINYFPLVNGKPQLNAQPKTAIKEAAELTDRLGMGITMEWSCLETDGADYFKEYMLGGIRYGYMDRPFLNYQLNGGPNSIRNECLRSSSPYVRTLYDELYQYIKGTLKESDISWQ